MWEAMMMLRLIGSFGPSLGHTRRTETPTLTAGSRNAAIRLSFAAWRLSLPLSQQPNSHENHGRRIA
ncbi:hypothetical protein [Mesorhizobium sp.]|uniref:hypothetical protein n=1 Tax=Mesorhizobium sp. TaxID=1871066 RepID=UPI0025E6AC09|nr:hypothetical protein [Mesorhizobium sp.]